MPRNGNVAFPEIDPVAFSVGFLTVRWYGLMYVVGFIGAWALAQYRTRRSDLSFSRDDVDTLIFYLAVGLILGARAGYVVFYNFDLFMREPSYLFRVWEGGMSFHGGLVGVIAAGWLFSKRYKKEFLRTTDFFAPLAPIGLTAGRFGNFINAELYGRPTDVPWGMIFPGAGPLPRHPSQLYQMALEGVLLFAILWWYSGRPRPAGVVSGLFLFLYGVFRTFVELFREPDAHIGFISGEWLTMGMLLSLPMVAAGAYFVIRGYQKVPDSSSASNVKHGRKSVK